MLTKNSVFASFIVLLALSLDACGSSSNSPAPVYSATPTPAATAVALPTVAPFSETVTTDLTSAPLTISIPAVSGYTESIGFGTPTSFIPGTTLKTVFANTLPSGAPTLASLLRKIAKNRAILAAGTASSSDSAISVITYDTFLFSNAVTYPEPPSFTLTVPSFDIVTANYYTAAYDPTRPSLGWQLAFEGPATVKSDTLSFTPASFTPYTFAANAYYYFASFAISTAATQPTAAPSIAPTAAATVTPTSTPVPNVSSTPFPDNSSAPYPDTSSAP